MSLGTSFCLCLCYGLYNLGWAPAKLSPLHFVFLLGCFGSITRKLIWVGLRLGAVVGWTCDINQSVERERENNMGCV